MTIWHDYWSLSILPQRMFALAVPARALLCLVSNGLMYLHRRQFVVACCEWPPCICVWQCVHLHLCTYVAWGANDSWHLAAISGSLISIERFAVEAQILCYLSNRCVFDLLTQLAHTFTHTVSIQSYWQEWIKVRHNSAKAKLLKLPMDFLQYQMIYNECALQTYFN